MQICSRLRLNWVAMFSSMNSAGLPTVMGSRLQLPTMAPTWAGRGRGGGGEGLGLGVPAGPDGCLGAIDDCVLAARRRTGLEE
jgi:hypothetical protein